MKIRTTAMPCKKKHDSAQLSQGFILEFDMKRIGNSRNYRSYKSQYNREMAEIANKKMFVVKNNRFQNT
jgi:hypothetical protein